MFVYTVRATRLRIIIVALLTLAAILAIIAFGFSGTAMASSGSVDFSGIKTNEERLEFISQFIPGVSGEPTESISFLVPENFDRIMLSYNEIQKSQGLDITKYKNKKVTRYTYEIKNYENSERSAFVNLVIYKGTVIACDVSSSNPTGFVKPLVSLN